MQYFASQYTAWPEVQKFLREDEKPHPNESEDDWLDFNAMVRIEDDVGQFGGGVLGNASGGVWRQSAKVQRDPGCLSYTYGKNPFCSVKGQLQREGPLLHFCFSNT